MPSVTLKWTAAAFAATVAVAAATAPAGGSEAKSGSQQIMLSSLNIRGNEQTVYVTATGPIRGVGTETQTEKESTNGQIKYVTLHFDTGTVRLVAPEKFEWRPDLRTCTARPVGGGTFRITGGTGAYRGATGKGTFTDGGIAIAQRTGTGKCLGDKTPAAGVVLYVTANMVGSVAIPAPA
jgi:hypothetical protein